MDQQFKKIIQKTKAWNQGTEPLAHTFEGALFKDSAWPFAFDESVTTESAMKQTIAPTTAPVASPAKTAMKVEPKVALKADALSLVLFVGDSYVEASGEDLLGKMIVAMKLRPGEFNRVPFNEKLEDVNDLAKNLTEPSAETIELLEQIKKFKPNIVVSLGATVTNILLGKREKLSGIHGQFFDKTLTLNNESYTYQVMPIFHPDFLIINPNMKRTAWIDLQKVMERVGKI
ncbi:uracil-DNA glycosylase family protein [Bacteriovorax sp. PP10]|uniref:Uracil-DNA glycosylase family protein n=1 Tax=Bacteriovorax antarcticus TaxID=3088717 RepID=A0ABU5VUW2_9BACT|nr:uracil-DNA glycosylase family protein [Bacteriovorax sp. PP10]MEA9355425.1 uracil-DNA glycosylase family protein [Bacteriovorax sp. PP10]